jgi:hypothetical protein
MVFELSSFLTVADIDLVRSFGANMLFLVVCADAEYRAGPPLTLATMAGDDGFGIGRYFDTQGAAAACSVLIISPLRYCGSTSAMTGVVD